MSGLLLKIIAIFSMTIDHINTVLLNDNSFLTLIGRIAFPIFCFMLVQGYNHTKNDKKRLNKYFLRLLIFAIIAEIPFRLCFNPENAIGGNVLFELILGLLALIMYDYLSKNSKPLGVASIFFFSIIALALRLDWDLWGILIIFAFYFYNQSHNKLNLTLNIAITSLVMFLWYTLFDFKIINLSTLTKSLETNYVVFGILLSLPIVFSYNDQKGYNSKLLQILFYAYYPLHLLVLYFLSRIGDGSLF